MWATTTGDGRLDFAAGSLQSGAHVYRNTGTGTFVLWAHYRQSPCNPLT